VSALSAFLVFCVFLTVRQNASAQNSSPHAKPGNTQSTLDPGSISNGVYRNSSLGFTCKIPAGWVLRTEEMNTPPESADDKDNTSDGKHRSQTESNNRVLLAAFSRPPQARGEDVNASILIAAESASAYPGLKDAAQYLGPVAEVAKAQGFAVEQDPYEFQVGVKTLVRGDFSKDVGTRVMHQSTLVMLVRGFAVSFTFIAGTEEDIEDLIANLAFTPPPKP
jgi:hypothetical protein